MHQGLNVQGNDREKMAEQPKNRTPEFRPPQFHRDDYELWVRDKERLENTYQRIDYSVLLGGEKPPSRDEIDYGEMWKRITARRIDAVGYTADHIALIEYRRNAGPSAIGQLMMYKALWEREKGTTLPIRLVLITDIATDAIIYTAKTQGIDIIILS